MPNQANLNGTIELGDDFSGYNEVQLFKEALQLKNWMIQEENSQSSGYHFFKINNGDITLNVHVYLKKVMWRHRKDDEKGIQFSADRVTTGYEVEQTANTKTVMIGIYKRENIDNYLICAWNPYEWGNLGKACNCFISVQTLAKAFQIGFTSDDSKLPRKVFAFSPEFLHYYLVNNVSLHEDISPVLIENQKENSKTKNIIYYGAPGTGKSHRVEQTIVNLDKHYYERVTFHPEFDNASFVGGYKPIENPAEGKEGEIIYKFVPQAFAKIYTRAWKNTDSKDFYLAIEEINRGNCAEIFGEIFQLLDRDSNYDVTPSEEFRKYLVEEFGDENHEGIKRGLKLPSNLHIWATMNTSDQSLFPMDSAFKRRWQWEYCPICYDAKTEEGLENKSYEFLIDIQDGKKYRWIEFIKKINLHHIKPEQNLGADKCIGNYFIKPDKGNTITLKPFINKVIFYLWNDVFKDEQNKVFEDNTSYEDFFPINTAGKQKVKEMFTRIGLQPIPDSDSANADATDEEQTEKMPE